MLDRPDGVLARHPLGGDRAVLAAGEFGAAPVEHWLTALGAPAVQWASLYDALAAAADDASAWSLLLLGCDGAGGLGPVRRDLLGLSARARLPPAVLVSS